MSTIVVHEDMYSIPGYPAPAEYFIDVKIECIPGNSHLPWRRWFCEVLARRSIWPPSKNEAQKSTTVGGDVQEHMWTHYHTYDFYVSSLRNAFWKSDDVAWKLYEDMQADPELRPDSDPGFPHAHPG